MANPAWQFNPPQDQVHSWVGKRRAKRRMFSRGLFWFDSMLRRALYLGATVAGPESRLVQVEQHYARALEAAQSARSALYGEQFSQTQLPTSLRRLPSLVIPRLRSAARQRLAAHAVTATVVLAVLLGAETQKQNTASVVINAERTAFFAEDPQVIPSVSTAKTSASNDITVPEVSGARLVPQQAFLENHRLMEGETLGELAHSYGVSVESIVWSNNLQNSEILAAGRQLRIPRIAGIPYTVEEGDTLDSIAEKLHVSKEAITLFAPNGIDAKNPLPVGREIFVPGASRPYPPELLERFGGERGLANTRAVVAGGVREDETNMRAGPGRDYPRVASLNTDQQLKLVARHDDWVKVTVVDVGDGWVRRDLLHISDAMFNNLAETNDFPPPPPIWVWPTQGTITSQYGYRTAPFRSYHNGLDIANAAKTKIYAARRGRVIEAGWCSGYGYCVKIDHGDGFSTIYGHLFSKPPVSVGDVVAAGELIGYMGSTFDRSGGGYSTGVHLHFTINLNGKAVDPLKFLP